MYVNAGIRDISWEGVGKCRCNVVVSSSVVKVEWKVERVMLVWESVYKCRCS